MVVGLLETMTGMFPGCAVDLLARLVDRAPNAKLNMKILFLRTPVSIKLSHLSTTPKQKLI